MQPEYPSIEEDIRVTNFDQQFYFVAYPKCKRGTDAYDDDDVVQSLQSTTPSNGNVRHSTHTILSSTILTKF